MKDFFKNILLISIPSLVVLFIILEIFLAFFMPLPGRPKTIYDTETDVLKFSPESGTGTYTKGKFFQLRADWSINNEGWNSPIDFQTDHNKDLTVVIGDSYVEALQVDIEKSYPNLLRDMLPEGREVYAFGKSLYPLSQYLHLSRLVVEKYTPGTLVFNVVHNDFDESLDGTGNIRFKSLMQVIVATDSSVTERKPFFTDYFRMRLNPGTFRTLVRKSRVQRYIRHPEYLGIQPAKIFLKRMNSATDEYDKEPQYENNINTEEVSEMKDQIELAVDYTIGKIREENPDKRIIFILDAPRGNIYSGGALEDSGSYWIHELLHEVTTRHQVEFIDLAPLMKADYHDNKKKFNSEVDWHWNEYGHQFVAETLYNYLMSSN